MSFSREVKEELSRQWGNARHCQIAELSAIISLCGHIAISADDRYSIRISTENIAVARKYFTLLKKTFNIYTDVSIRQGAYLVKGRTYTVIVKNHDDALKVIQAARLLDMDGEIKENLSIMDNSVVMKDCCKRAFLRGAFLASGSVSNPKNSYHFEIVCATEQKAVQVQQIMKHFKLDAKVVMRNRHYVVYIKDSEDISLALNLMEAHVALMELENVRILKDLRNSVNRQVNCETANLNKIAKTACRQIEDIRLIEKLKGLDYLPTNLLQIASVRLEHPEASLVELGALLDPPVGKSGVNHRLRKIAAIAEQLR